MGFDGQRGRFCHRRFRGVVQVPADDMNVLSVHQPDSLEQKTWVCPRLQTIHRLRASHQAPLLYIQQYAAISDQNMSVRAGDSSGTL
eukprot:scaffold3084_cov144-Cylindrotheca_fusiformis.AAC.50